MAEFVTLHPYDPVFVARYVVAVTGSLPPAALLPGAPAWAEREIDRAQRGYARALDGHEAGANAVSHGLARMLATTEPVFVLPDAGFTQLEARIDRGIGMLLRPPSRLFADAGMPIPAARAMPIRLDAAGGTMGGAHIPPALTPQFRDFLEQRMDRLALRLAESELDAPAYVAALMEAAAYAADRGLGLVEAIDVMVPGMPESEPPGARLIIPDSRRLAPDLRKRLQEASRPPKEPGLLARLFGRGKQPRGEDQDDGRRWRGMNDVTPTPERQNE